MRVLLGGAGGGIAALHHLHYAKSHQQAEDDAGHGPTKRARRTGPAQLQAPEGILTALDKWSQAVRASFDLMEDRKICTNVLAELGQLENEVRTNTFKGETTTLRAIAECPFPQAFVDILQTIEAFEGKPLLECVAAGVAIEHRIQEGRKSTADSSGLGQGQIAFLADRKVQEVERFELRVERQQSEQQQQGKHEELASARHIPDLGAAEKSLREMREEEGRIRMELAKVHAEAARQRALLEKILQAKGKGGESVGGSRDSRLNAVRDAAWKGKEINLSMTDLLRARGGADRAIECVSAAGQHLSFVCHVAEFVREARAAMTAQCDEILEEALQQEVALLQHDRENVKNVLDQLEKVSGGKEAGGNCGMESGEHSKASSSLGTKYRKFYMAQLRVVNARHIRSRFAAASLVASLKQGPDACSSMLCDMAAQVVQAVDDQRAPLRVKMLQSELPAEVDKNGKKTTLITWPADSSEQEGPSSLQFLASDSRVRARVSAQECRRQADAEMCQLVQASCTQTTMPAQSIPFLLGCLHEALSELCKGSVRSAVCMMPDISLKSAEGAVKNASGANASLLSVALMQTRAEFFWLHKIAVVDFSSLVGGKCLAAHPAMTSGPDILILAPHGAGAGTSTEKEAVAFEDDGGAKEHAVPPGTFSGDWKLRLEEDAKKIANFQPQLLVFYLDAPALASEEAARHKPKMNWAWAGKWAAGVAHHNCQGRALTVSSSPGLISEFVLGSFQE